MNSVGETMKATVIKGKMELQVERFPLPHANPGEVVIQIKAVGVCPSGLKLLKDPSRLPDSFLRIPGVPGHEIAAEVIEVGESVGDFSPGDRVVPTFGPTCGACYYCRRGLFQHCERRAPETLKYMGFAEFMACPAASLVPIPSSISDEEASFTEPLACCVASVDKCSIHAGDEVVVIGAGTMGLLHVQLTHARGAKVIVVELREDRRRFALEMGAEVSLQVDEDIDRIIMKRTDGRGAAAVIVAVGSISAIEQAFNLVRPGGTLMLFAGTWPAKTISLDPNIIHYGQIKVTGSVGGLIFDFEQALALLASGVIDVQPLVTARFPLEEVMQAHLEHEAGTGYKVLVKP